MIWLVSYTYTIGCDVIFAIGKKNAKAKVIRKLKEKHPDLSEFDYVNGTPMTSYEELIESADLVQVVGYAAGYSSLELDRWMVLMYHPFFCAFCLLTKRRKCGIIRRRDTGCLAPNFHKVNLFQKNSQKIHNLFGLHNFPESSYPIGTPICEFFAYTWSLGAGKSRLSDRTALSEFSS